MSIVCVAVTCIAIVGAQALAMVCLGLRLIQRGEELAAVKGQLASSKRKKADSCFRCHNSDSDQ